MGYTDFTKKMVDRAIGYTKPEPWQRVIELGAQNDHTSPIRPMPYMHDWFSKMGFDEYQCIDLNGENEAFVHNLAQLQNYYADYHLVTNIGTFEHVSGPDGLFSWDASYNCWRNMFDLALVDGGIIYSESPQTGSWPGHGVAYLTTEFIYQLTEAADLSIVDIGLHAACHNTRNGWNVWCILRKTGTRFPTLDQFKTFNLRQS